MKKIKESEAEANEKGGNRMEEKVKVNEEGEERMKIKEGEREAKENGGNGMQENMKVNEREERMEEDKRK